MAEQSDKIRVIIVDDIPDTRDNLEKLLYFERDVEVVGKAGTGREAVALAKQLQPDIVLMDINMPDMDGITATEAIMSQVHVAQVIIMSVQGEADYLRRAMLAGAREFLTKPISGDELVASIRKVHRLGVDRTPVVTPLQSTGDEAAGQVIAIFSPKGGVGVTTLSANLAVALKLLPGHTNKRIALVDANLIFGDIGVALYLPSNKTITELVSRVNDLDRDLLEDVMATHNSQVKVLLAPLNPQEGELVTSDHLRLILDTLRREFDYVVVDTQSSFQDQTMGVLDIADRILMIMTMEMTAIKNIKQFLEVAELLGYPPEKLMLVLNKADSRLGLRVDQIESNLKHKVVAQIANAPNEVTMSVNQGVPLVIDKRNHQVARDILALAALISNSGAIAAANQKQQATQEQQAQQQGLLTRLLGKR